MRGEEFAQRRVLLIIDNKAFRRAQLKAFIAHWAKEADLEILENDTSDAATLVDIKVSLVLFRLGHAQREIRQLRRVAKLIKVIFPGASLVLLADGEGGASVREALAAGCQGYLPSSFAPDLALAALSFVLAGGTYFPAEALDESQPPPGIQAATPALLRAQDGEGIRALRKIDDNDGPIGALGASVARSGKDHVPTLTTRQIEVLGCLRDGQSNKAIARNLAMAEATVKVHVRQIMRKFGVQNRTQVAVCAAAREEGRVYVRRAS